MAERFNAVRNGAYHPKTVRKGAGSCTVTGCSRPIYSLKKKLCHACYEQLRKRGTTDRTIRPRGAGTFMACGYVRVRDGSGGKLLAHRVIAERALGRPLPAGAVVHHADGDRANNSNANLVICPSRQYHELLHKRQAALEATGDASALRCYVCKTYDAAERINTRGVQRHKTGFGCARRPS